MPDGHYSTPGSIVEPAPKPRVVIETPHDLPLHTPITVVTPRNGVRKVRAALADQDGEFTTTAGNRVAYRNGADYIVDDELGARTVVRKDIFEKSYRRIARGLYKTRHNLRLRAAVADRDMDVMTLDGVRTAHRTDWIMIGVADEMWPAPVEVAREKYRPVSAVGWTGVGVTIVAVFALLMFAMVMATGH